jgi:hypothetical protein
VSVLAITFSPKPPLTSRPATDLFKASNQINRQAA